MREWKSRTCMFCVRMHITSHRRIRFGKNTYPFWAVPKHATEIRLFGKKFSIRMKVHSILPPSEQHRPAKSYATSFGTFGHRVTLDFGRHFWKGMKWERKSTKIGFVLVLLSKSCVFVGVRNDHVDFSQFLAPHSLVNIANVCVSLWFSMDNSANRVNKRGKQRPADCRNEAVKKGESEIYTA